MSDTRDLRLKLLENGWSPLPNVGKTTYLRGWPTTTITPEEINSWSRRHSRWQDTGLRLDNGLAVIDMDIDDEIIGEVASELEKTQQGLERALIRYGKGYKEAWFIRCEEQFGRIATRRWLAPGTVAEDGRVACMEIFGGATPRQFGAIGAHTREPDGSVKIAYEWEAAGSPLDTRLDALPEFTKAHLIAMVDLCERVFEAAGWTPVQRSVKGEQEAARVFDLTEDMVFVCNDGVYRSLAELQAVAGEPGLRCSASWIEGPTARRTDRCLVTEGRNGTVMIWETTTGVTHLPASAAPTDRAKPADLTDMAKAIMEKIAKAQDAEAKARRVNKVADSDDLKTTASKLLNSYALCPSQQLPVVPIWADDITDAFSMQNFRHTYAPHSEPAIGKDGQELKTRIHPADLWLNSKRRLTVAGLRMRPDQPRPTYEEQGKVWVNVYARPLHAAEPEGVDVFIEFMEHLHPDEAERAYFMDALAHKLRHPEVPGPGLLMVSPLQGAGRGTLFGMLRQLYGTKYARKVDPVSLTGEGGQSQYNTWLANSTVILIDELFNAGDGAVFWRRKKAYDRIKTLIDPSAREVEIIQKTLNNYVTMTYASLIMATNNANALPLDDDDRRICVLTNGGKLADNPGLTARLNAYRQGEGFTEGFIAGIAVTLMARDLAGFDAFAPPPTFEGKLSMIHRNMTDVGEATDEVIAELPGDYVTRNALIERVKMKLSEGGGDHAVHKHLVDEARDRIDRSKWVFMGRVKINEKESKADVWARDEAAAKRWYGVSWSEREGSLAINSDARRKQTATMMSALARGIGVIDGGKT